MTHNLAAAATAAAFVALAALPAQAGNVIEDWDSIKRAPAPALKPVKADPKTTALLMLDFMNQNCGKRPACVASVPAVKALLEKARAAKATVVYTFIANTTGADVLKEVAPQPGEPNVTSGPDKFVNTDLEKLLKDKGIKTVIAVGTASNGAVLFTASAAAFRNMDVIVPVDGMSSNDPYVDQTTAYTLATAPRLSQKVTLTTLDKVSF
jgi:nicotinamidase-related amidase